MKSIIRRQLLTPIVIAFLVHTSWGAATFSDGAFSGADWKVTVLQVGHGGMVSAKHYDTAGNPGAYFRITTSVEPAVSPASPSRAIGFFERTNAVYDPRVSGAIRWIDYAEDARMSAFFGFDNGQAASPALKQDGKIYVLPHPGYITPETAWSAKSKPGLVATNFVLLDPSVPPIGEDPGRHPDFSAAGSPMQFGFERSNATDGNGYQIEGGIDNWSLTVINESASTVLWINPNAGDYLVGTNWSGGAAPGALDWSEINNGGTAQLSAAVTNNVLLVAAQTASGGTLEVLPGATLNVLASPAAGSFNIGQFGAGELRQTGGTINFGQASAFQASLSLGELAGSSGVYTLSGGNLNVYSGGTASPYAGFNVGREGTGLWNVWGGKAELRTFYVGKTGNAVGTVNQTHGTVNVGVAIAQADETRIGGATSADANAVGTYNISGGTFTNAGNYQIGAYGKGTNNLSGSALVTVNGWPSIARFAGSTGELNVNNGTFNQTQSGCRLLVGEQGAGYLNVGSNGILNLVGMYLGSGSTANGTVNLDGGTINCGPISRNAGTATFNFNGGTLRFTANNLTVLASPITSYVKPGGAVLDVGNNTTTISGNLLDGGGGLRKLGTGTLALSGANTYSGDTVVSAGVLAAGSSTALPAGPGKGQLVVNSGCTFGMSANDVTLNAISGSGTIRNMTTARTLRLGGQGDSFTFSGVIKGNSGYGGNPVIVKEGAGTMTLAGTQDNAEAFLTVNQGTVVLAKASASAPDVHALGWGATVNTNASLVFDGTGNDQIWDGGSLTMNGGTADFNGRNESLSALLASGRVLNNAPNTVSTLTLGALDGSGAFGGVLQDGAGKLALNKTGTGVLTLSGTNTYSAGTTVSAGTLIVDGLLSGVGAVLLSGSATLAGGGTVNSDVIASGSVQPGNPNGLAAGTMTLNNLLMTAGGSLSFHLSDVTNLGGAFNDLLTVNGYLFLGGNPVAITPLAPGLAPGHYRLLNYNGPKSGSFGAVSHNTRYDLSLDESVTHQVDLVVAGGTNGCLRWTGAANSLWDVAASTNWLHTGSTTPDRFMNLDWVLFDDTAGVPTNVTLATAAYPGGVTVNAATNDFVFSGRGRISGGGGIAKWGATTLTISNANDFTGPVVIQAGTIRAGNDFALGAPSGATTIQNGGTLDVNGFGFGAEPVFVVGNGADGQGAIVNRTAGNINTFRHMHLTGDTSFGGTERWDIRSAVADDAFLSTGGQPFNLTKAGSFYLGWQAVTVDPALADIGIQEGGISYETTTTSLGDPTKTVTVASNAWVQLWNAVNPINKRIVLSNGAWLGASAGTQNKTVNDILLPGGLSGIWSSADCTLNLAGPVRGAGGLVKVDSGLLILSGTNSYGGGTIAVDGTLQLGNAGVGGDAGTGPITNNATLQFNRSDVLTFTNVISGTGVVVHAGSGTTVFPVANSYAGQTLLNTGALRVTHPAALGAPSGITWVSGALATGRLELDGGLDCAEAVTLSARTAASNLAAHIVNLSGNNRLSGPITLTTGGELYTFVSDSGKLTIASGLTPAGALKVLRCSGPGGLEFTGSVAASTSWGANAVQLLGPGTLTLSGASTYTNGTEVSAGTLLVSGSLANTAVNVAGGTLEGSGLIAGPVTVRTNGTLSPGSGLGTLTISNAVTLTGNTIIELVRLPRVLTNDLLRGISTLALGGTLTVLTTNSSADFTDGDTFKLFAATSYSGGFTNFVLPDLGPCLTWDTSGLTVNGTLKLVGAAARPVITEQPATRATLLGNTVVFQVTASSSSQFNYQWLFNGGMFAGQTNRTLTVTNAQIENLGLYSVVVSADGCFTLSESARLSAAVPPSLRASQFIDPAMILSFTTEVGPKYMVEYSDSLRPPDWKILATRAGTGYTVSLADPSPPLQCRFYRIRLQ